MSSYIQDDINYMNLMRQAIIDFKNNKINPVELSNSIDGLLEKVKPCHVHFSIAMRALWLDLDVLASMILKDEEEKKLTSDEILAISNIATKMKWIIEYKLQKFKKV